MVYQEGTQLGNYRLLRLLGRGGFAEVYLGEHIHMRRQAAIKVLHTRLAEDAIANFRREAQIIAELRHPHIVTVFDFALQENVPFLVMDYYPQGSLRKRHARGTRLPLALVVDYVRQMADALQYAHERRIIHRDVKPENMLIGPQGEIILTDFGIAAIAHSTTSLSQQEFAGTPYYMAPEQIQAQGRPASDQYTLAVVVYEWLTGAPPFQGTVPEIYAKQLLAEPQPLRERVSHLDPEVEQVVLMALRKDPRQRFATITAFATALAAAARQGQASVQQSGCVEAGKTSQMSAEDKIPTRQEESPAESGEIRANGDEAVEKLNASRVENRVAGEQISLPGASGVPMTLPVTPLVAAYPELQGENNPPKEPGEPPERKRLEEEPGKLLRRKGSQKRASSPLTIITLVLLLLLAGSGAFLGGIRWESAQALQRVTKAASVQTAGIGTPANGHPYPSYLPGNGHLLWYDPMNSGANWESRANRDKTGYCAFMNSKYHATHDVKGFRWCANLQSGKLINFAFEVRLTIVKGDCGGVFFRENIQTMAAYMFIICQWGQQDFYQYLPAQNSMFYVEGSVRELEIHKGLNQSNLLDVVAQGAILTLFINGHQISRVQDTSYTEGNLGTAAVDWDHPTDVIFNDATVWTL